MSLIPKFYMDAVASIGVRTKEKILWIGTGFFVIKEVGENQFQPFMVTNKHVIDGLNSVVIRLREKDTGELRCIDMPLMENANHLYSVHPDNKVDVAVVLLNGSYITQNNLQFSGFNIEKNAFSSKDFLKKGGNEGSFVYMLGYPMGLVNIGTNIPICRGGCIARIDPNEIEKEKVFLLDIQNFPGNSGSPIISKPEVIGIGDDPVLNQAVLIGIVHGYIPYEEQLINSQTQKVVEVRSENSGIAVANPVEFIREVIEIEMERKYGK